MFAIRSAQIGENGIEMDKNGQKFNLPGVLTAGGFSLPATIMARIGRSGVRLCQTLLGAEISSYMYTYWFQGEVGVFLKKNHLVSTP